jgi:tetratricopeptide (TPR) repeat protein
MMFYVHKIVWPDVLSIDYCRTPAWVAGLSWRNPYLLMALPAAGLLYALRRRPRWLALAGAFAAGILPVSGLVPFAYQATSTVADRYLYLSMAVVGMASAAVVASKPRSWVIGLFLTLVVLLGVRSYDQCRKWKNTETIMGHTLQYFPCSFRANLNYGIALMSRGEFAAAVPFYEAARQLRPDDPLPYYNLGLTYAATGDDARCDQMYLKLAAMDQAKAERLKQAAAEFKSIAGPGASGSIPDGVHVERESQP